MFYSMDELVRAFQDVDANLRLVFALSEVSWDLLYVRDDVADTYSESDFEATYREHMGNRISASNLRQTIDGGEYHGEMYFFEDIVVFQFPSARHEAVVVSYDWDETAPIADVFEVAKNADM